LASFPVLVVVGVGALLWPALSGGQEEAAGYPTVALSFLWLPGLAETGGSYLYARRGKRWGRILRAFGWAAFVPLWMGCYTLWFWSTLRRLGFVVMSALLGVWVVGVAFRLVRLAWRRE
jgi:FtsH-binding integral membrane protein